MVSLLLIPDVKLLILEILGVGSLRAHGRCRGLKVLPSCSQNGTLYSLFSDNFPYDVSFSHNAL